MRRIIAVFVLYSAASGQTVISGGTVVYDAVVNSPFTTYTQIYVVFPPQASGNNNTNLKSVVMTQASIDGVTVPVHWSAVETIAPTTTPCSPVGTDVCQQDPAAPTYYHTYDNWSAIDGTGCTDFNADSVSQWFCDFPSGSGTFKKVNLMLFGITQGALNTYTPNYVTQSWWASAVGFAQPQDAVNTIDAGGCGGYAGNAVPVGSRWAGDNTTPNSTIKVTLWPGHGFVEGDTIWVNGATDPLFNYTGQYGATVHFDSTSAFHYTARGQTGSSQGGTNISAISANQSWLVPYESPYAAAWQAFLRAAIYHFNNLNILGTGRNQTVSQIGYIRPGISSGGEAVPLCTLKTPMTNANPAFSKSVWVSWYATVNSAIQAANPRMQILYSINSSDPQFPNADYATQEAGTAVSYGNSTGMYNGFGSQGLAQADTGFNSSSCPDDSTLPDTGNNWGCMFLKYWSGSTGTIGTMTASPTTVPLELQQIDCSNPTGYTSTNGNNCFQGNPQGQGKTGNLSTLFPFAASNHVSVIELYSQDALLAFDPNYCNDNGTTCVNSSPGDWFGSSLSADTQFNFYTHVGQGTLCGGTGSGDCSYATVIQNAHGYH